MGSWCCTVVGMFSSFMLAPQHSSKDTQPDAENAAPASSSSKAPDPDGDGAPVGMKQSHAQLERTKLSKKFKNTIQLTLWWLADRCKRCTAILMGKVAYPLLKAHGEPLASSSSLCGQFSALVWA